MTTEDDIMVLARRSLKTGGRSSLGEILLVEDVKISGGGHAQRNP